MKHHRLRQLIEALGATPANFEKRYLGESRAKNIYNWLEGEFKMKEETIEKIVEAVKAKRPEFNEDWFRNGNGAMFGGNPSPYGEGGFDVMQLMKDAELARRELEEVKKELELSRQENQSLKKEVSLLHVIATQAGVDLGKLRVVADARYLIDMEGASENLLNAIFNNIRTAFGYSTGYNRLAQS